MEAVKSPVGKKKPQLTAFGTKLRELRTAAGMTQAELGIAAELHAVTISRFEAGSLDPTWTNIIKLATVFGKSPDVFLGHDDPPEPPTVRRTGKKK